MAIILFTEIWNLTTSWSVVVHATITSTSSTSG
jgi:hypothetical protein